MVGWINNAVPSLGGFISERAVHVRGGQKARGRFFDCWDASSVIRLAFFYFSHAFWGRFVTGPSPRLDVCFFPVEPAHSTSVQVGGVVQSAMFDRDPRGPRHYGAAYQYPSPIRRSVYELISFLFRSLRSVRVSALITGFGGPRMFRKPIRYPPMGAYTVNIFNNLSLASPPYKLTLRSEI